MAKKGQRKVPIVLATQGAVTKGVECDHGICKQVRRKAEIIFQNDASSLGINRQQQHKALAVLPRLLCEAGIWPPPGVAERTLLALYVSFVLACIDLDLTTKNLRGQKLSNYETFREKCIKLAQQGNKESSEE